MIRNKVFRWLIVITNCLIALIAVPITVFISIGYTVYQNIRYELGINMKTAFGWYIDGLRLAYESNRELIKTGKITSF